MIEYTPTPDFYNNYIQHYGVKGMKWKNHKKPTYANDTDYHKKLNAMSNDEYWKLVEKSHAGKSKGGSSSNKKSGSSGTKGSGGSSKSAKESSGSSKAAKETSEKSQTDATNAKENVRKIIDRTKAATKVAEEKRDYRIKNGTPTKFDQIQQMIDNLKKKKLKS